MSSQAHPPRARPGGASRLRWLASCLVAVLIFAIDTFTPWQSAVAVLYILVLIIADDGASRRPLLGFGAICAVLALASFMLTHALGNETGSVLRLLFSLAILGLSLVLILRNRRMQVAIREQDLRYRTIFDTLAVAIWEHDFRALQQELARMRAAGIIDLRAHFGAHPDIVPRLRALVPIANANSSAFRLLDVPEGAPFFTHLAQILPEDDESFVEGMIVLANGGRLFEAEMRLCNWHGQEVDVFIALTFPPGAGLGCISGSVTDVTERKRVQAALDRTRSELDRALRAATVGEMSASIAHEVSQPLTAVRTCLEAARRWLDRPGPDVGEALGAIGQAAREAEKAGEVVNRVRRLVGRVAPELAPLDLDRLIEATVALAQRQFGQAHLTLIPGGRGARVAGDRLLLQQLLINLIGNAVEAGGGGPVLVQTRADEAMITIAVADQGPGMAGAVLERAFEPFYSTRPGAIGLGLTICRSIVEAHRGTIVMAAPQGGGTLVTVTLPRAAQGDEAGAYHTVV
jgi:two-component system, LuxR family, sensor kinase FixL